MKQVKSVYDLNKLQVGDRVCHGQNNGTVFLRTNRGPCIRWDDGRVDYWYHYVGVDEPFCLVHQAKTGRERVGK